MSLWTTNDPERNLLYTFDFCRDNRFRECIMKVKWIAKSEIALAVDDVTKLSLSVTQFNRISEVKDPLNHFHLDLVKMHLFL